MRKISLIITLFFSFSKLVYAETYYGEYKRVDDVSNYPLDMIKIESKKLFNTYESKYIDMGYMLENDLYIKDEIDYKEEYIEVSENEISDEYINISPNTKTVSSIAIRGLENYMKIYELEMYINDEIFNYSYAVIDRNMISKIKDNNLETYVTGEDLKNILAYIHKTTNLETIKLKLITNDNIDYNLNILLGYEQIPITLKTEGKNQHIINFKKENESENKVRYTYKGYKKLYKYYKEEKELLNNYVEYGNNTILDDFVEYKEYYKRDKLVLTDEFIINDYNKNITDFIEYSSDRVNINCNIEYGVNGIYTCSFILNDIVVNKDIIIDVPKKEVNKVLIKKSNRETINNNQSNNKKENIKSEKIENKILSNKVNDIKFKNKENVTRKNQQLNKNKIINIIKYIIILNLIIIEIILFIKKKKK